MTPSPEQQHIYDTITTTPDNYLIVASAGSGKSTVIAHLTRLFPLTTRILVLAFNKTTEEQMTAKVSPAVDCHTFHKYGMEAMRHSKRWAKIDKNKLVWLLKDHLSDDKKFYRSRHNIRLVDLAKGAGVGLWSAPQPSDFTTIIEHHELTEDYDIPLCLKLLDLSNADTKRMDFNDMLYFPLLLNLSFPPYDTIFIDEAQDTNAVQLEILRRSTSRIIAVGDPSQAIYGFRGADATAMHKMKTTFNMTVLPLSVSFRCSQSVVAFAQRYDSGIELIA